MYCKSTQNLHTFYLSILVYILLFISITKRFLFFIWDIGPICMVSFETSKILPIKKVNKISSFFYGRERTEKITKYVKEIVKK